MQNFINWLVTSSADPRKTSLALKGVLTLGASYLLSIAPVVCSLFTLCFDTSILTTIIDVVVKIVDAALVVVGGFMFLWGIMRKIVLGRWAHPNAV